MPSPRAECVVLARLGLAASALAGCSFGYQSVYEGDVRFEHCYRLDDEPRVTSTEKQRCWSDWSRRYTYGQTRDRIAYALARERALAAAASGAAPSAPMIALGTNNISPQPTNAFAPPPQLLTQTDAGALSQDAAGDGPSASASIRDNAPGAPCAGVCARDFAACGASCQADGCFNGCDEKYRSCMRSCF